MITEAERDTDWSQTATYTNCAKNNFETETEFEDRVTPSR